MPNYKLKVRKQKDCDPVYVISWYDNGKRKEKSTGTGDITQAARFLDDFIKSKDTTTIPINKYGVVEALDRYYDEHGRHTTDPKRIHYAIDALKPFWSNDTIHDITPNRVRQYGSFRNVSNGTLRRELGTLRSAIRHAWKERRIPEDIYIPLPPKPEVQEKWLTDEEFARLLTACKHQPELWLYCLIRRYTGQRSVAVLSLTWSSIDLGRRVIHWGSGKGAKRRAKIQKIISQQLYEALDSFYGKRNEKVISYTPESIKTVFYRAADRANITGASPSWLRHTCITRLLQNGATIEQVSEYVGLSVQMIQRTYWHHSPDHQKNLPL